jgi:hypothetical protein
MTEKVGIDPAFVPDKVQVRANDYVAGADPADPAISPLFRRPTRVTPDVDPGRIE